MVSKPKRGYTPCPKCKSSGAVYEEGPRNFWCNSCKIAFDNAPDEGGTHSNDPTRRAEREESHEIRTRMRRFADPYGPRPQWR